MFLNVFSRYAKKFRKKTYKDLSRSGIHLQLMFHAENDPEAFIFEIILIKHNKIELCFHFVVLRDINFRNLDKLE